jgi:ubiquinone/menaquinone biosynthesis C-methylase UbiE
VIIFVAMISQIDSAFVGSLPKVYEKYLVPVFFEPYAKDIANRLKTKELSNILEVAAGTGVVTRFMDSILRGNVNITATDLNQDMLNEAAQAPTKREIEWRQADAMQLPFADETFDAVICQFGVMFFPDRPKAYAEAYRVLKPGGVFLFNVWDSLEDNDFANAVNAAMETVFPSDPPRFLPRTPYSYFNETVIAQDLAKAGFKTVPSCETVTCYTTAATPDVPAHAICLGTPLRTEIQNNNAAMLDKAIAAAAGVIAKRFGNGPVEGKLQAKVVEVKK